jgi:hypothetical protein
MLGFQDLRVQGNSPLGFPDTKTPKYQLLNLLIYFGVSAIGISQVGVSGIASTRELALGFPGYRNFEIPSLKPAHLISRFIPSVFRKSGFQDLRVQGNSPLGFSDTETPKHQLLNLLILFRGFFHRDFASRGFGTCEYKGTRPWVSRIPKLRNTNS